MSNIREVWNESAIIRAQPKEALHFSGRHRSRPGHDSFCFVRVWSDSILTDHMTEVLDFPPEEQAFLW